MFIRTQNCGRQAGTNDGMKVSPKLMYAAGAVAGALAGALILWLLFPRTAEAEGHETFDRISISELEKALAANAVTVIDVRGMDQYLAGHIPGALHIPVSMLEGEVSYLPKDKPIVTYCSCPAEESSGQAAMILAHAGVGGTTALTGGFDAWVKQGLPVAAGREPR